MKIKAAIVCLIALTLLALAAAVVVAASDIDEFRNCSYCGMDRKAYGYSRMMVAFDDGLRLGVCSLHCAVTEIDTHKGRGVKSLLVADRNSRQLIAAEKAIWVMGGGKRGVMTPLPKWAFATIEAAQAFQAASGGKISSWESVLLAARESQGATKQGK